jgi:hypothetical protein
MAAGPTCDSHAAVSGARAGVLTAPGTSHEVYSACKAHLRIVTCHNTQHYKQDSATSLQNTVSMPHCNAALPVSDAMPQLSREQTQDRGEPLTTEHS